MSHKELNRQLCAVGLPAMSLGEKPGGGGLRDMGGGPPGGWGGGPGSEAVSIWEKDAPGREAPGWNMCVQLRSHTAGAPCGVFLGDSRAPRQRVRALPNA